MWIVKKGNMPDELLKKFILYASLRAPLYLCLGVIILVATVLCIIYAALGGLQ